DRLLGSKDRFAEGVILPEVLGEDLMYEVVWAVLVHFDFFQDHAAFARDVPRIEYRVKNQIGEHIESDGKMLVENFDVEANTLFGGEGVHVSADRVDLTGDVFGGARLGSFEDHVFNEMRDPVVLGVLVARSGFDPNADGYGAYVFHLLGQNGQTIGKDCALDVARFVDQ